MFVYKLLCLSTKLNLHYLKQFARTVKLINDNLHTVSVYTMFLQYKSKQ